mgnify:CR=1 FL=1
MDALGHSAPRYARHAGSSMPGHRCPPCLATGILHAWPYGVLLTWPAGIFHTWPHGVLYAWPAGVFHARPRGVLHAWPYGVPHAWPHGIFHTWPRGVLHAWPAGIFHTWPHGVLHAWPAGIFHTWPHGVLLTWPAGRLRYQPAERLPIRNPRSWAWYRSQQVGLRRAPCPFPACTLGIRWDAAPHCTGHSIP